MKWNEPSFLDTKFSGRTEHLINFILNYLILFTLLNIILFINILLVQV